MTVSRPRGKPTSRFLRLCWRAPRTSIDEGPGARPGARVDSFGGRDTRSRIARAARLKRGRPAYPWAGHRTETGGRRPALARCLQPQTASQRTPVARHHGARVRQMSGELGAPVEQSPVHALRNELLAQGVDRVLDVELLAREDVDVDEAPAQEGVDTDVALRDQHEA